MSLFDNIADTADDIVLTKYDYVWSDQYKDYYLRPKGYLNSPYAPANVVWKWYMRDDPANRIKYRYGFCIQINKNDFLQYVGNYKDINRLVYKGKTYYDLSILHPLFDSFDNRIIEEYLNKEEKQNQNSLYYECI